jgi:hypothetical protein
VHISRVALYLEVIPRVDQAHFKEEKWVKRTFLGKVLCLKVEEKRIQWKREFKWRRHSPLKANYIEFSGKGGRAPES